MSAANSDTQWWEGLDDLDIEGPPSAATHRLVVCRGELSSEAHGDAEAEAAMVALGGDPCPCLDVMAAWRAQHETPSILVVGARHHGEVLQPPIRVIEELQADLNRWRNHLGGLRSAARSRRDIGALERLDRAASGPARAAAERLGFLLLLSLDRRVQIRLQASVAAALAVAGRIEELTVPTAVRALPWLRASGFAGNLEGVRLVESVTPGAASEAGSAHVRSTARTMVTPGEATLPADWIARVWAHGEGSSRRSG